MHRRAATIAAITIAAAAPALTIAPTAGADPGHKSPTTQLSHQRSVRSLSSWVDRHLTPRTHFTMNADGSSGKTQGGEGIPNIDSVKSTIRTYYGAGSDGIANKTSSPYVSEMHSILAKETKKLKVLYKHSAEHGKKPAMVFDADDTTLLTYDMEDHAMHFNFDPVLQDTWVQDQRFPATPAMPAFIKAAQRAGFTIFGLTGRNDDQKVATVANLKKVGYTGFDISRFYTKWTGKGDSQQPSYIHCAAVKCTTVEFKAGTRKHIESMGYDIALNVGDQFSDLQGGHTDHNLKLPNPTYYLPSPDLPGVHEPWLSPRKHFTMKADGSSGKTQGGEGIPNFDSAKSTIRTYYNAGSDGIASKTSSPYISEMKRRTSTVAPLLSTACTVGRIFGAKPAIVLDADDTTLMTYDMEDNAMHFNFDPPLQDVWVQGQKFPATPGMVRLVNSAHRAGCALIGLTGRNDDQKAATLGNLTKVGFQGFTARNFYTKWTGKGASQQPPYIHCKSAKCTTIEYKSQTRAHVQTRSGGGYNIIANFGDQFSDLIGGNALVPVKLPNPTYYLP